MSDASGLQIKFLETLSSILEFLKSYQIEHETDFPGSKTLSEYLEFVQENKGKEFEWQQLSDCFEYIFMLCTEDIGRIRKKIDENVKKRVKLLEVYEKLDQERARKRIQKSMVWIRTEEEVLGKIKSHVTNSLQDIDSQYERFVNKSKENCKTLLWH